MSDNAERRHASLALDARPASVPTARARLCDLLTGWERAVLLDDAELLVSALVADVVRWRSRSAGRDPRRYVQVAADPTSNHTTLPGGRR